MVNNENQDIAIIFIHGLEGDAYKTWGLNNNKDSNYGLFDIKEQIDDNIKQQYFN